jgi:hypothetical protein
MTIERPADILFPERIPAKAAGICVLCLLPATEFRDEISRREYDISILCQDCQDEVFAPEEYDADDV